MAAGERVEVIDAMDDGWSHVRVAGAVGCVPSSYVAVADDRARDAAAAEQLAAAFADDLEALAPRRRARGPRGSRPGPRSPSATPTKLRGGRGDALDGPLAAPVRAASVERARRRRARAADARAVAPAHTPWAPAPVEVGDPFAPLGAPVRVASIDFETLKARAAARRSPPREPRRQRPSPPSDPPPEAEATVDAPPFAAIPAVAAAPPSDPPPEPGPAAAIPAVAAAPPSDPPPEPEPEPAAAIPAFAAAPPPPALAPAPPAAALPAPSSGAGGKKCAHCGQTLPLGKFSKKQWKAGPGVRKCKDCEDDHHF
ncbi:hypothetical protein JL722_11659 [Aureococcus anophagefferens]|nr:hypothetical protein JL722_11659 [Aureococcus anophagefferens]